jgi:hypothetical protein
MAQWGNTDDAANSVLWAASQLNKTANTGNQTALFGNTTAGAFVTGVIVGQYGVDANEAQAARAEVSGDRAAHAGWVLRTTGSGGRAGRIQTEVLVAMSSIGTDADGDDGIFEDYTLRIVTQPSNTTANTTAGQNATFTVVGASTPAGATLAYAWTYANGTAIATNANVGVTTGATLTINSAVQTANAGFKVAITATGAGIAADAITSSNATLTITT